MRRCRRRQLKSVWLGQNIYKSSSRMAINKHSIAKARARICWLYTIFILSACSTQKPTSTFSFTQNESGYRQNSTLNEALNEQDALSAATWAGFDDPLLMALVGHASKHNLDVQIAVARVKEARAGLKSAQSRGWPSVSATTSTAEQKTSLPEFEKQRSPDTQISRAGIEIGWELDLFGATRATSRAQGFDALGAEAGVHTAQWISTTEIARQYLIWQGARLRLRTLEALLQTQRDTEQLIKSRESAGMASRFQVSQAASKVSATTAQLPPLRSLVAVTEHQIDLLLGSTPTENQWDWRGEAHTHLALVPLLHPGQPAELLLRRPDLRVAEQQLLTEAARLRARQADRWPRLILAAAVGQQDLRLNQLDLSPARFSNVSLGLTAPLFNAGLLKAAVEQQSSRVEQATLKYEQAVLGAVRDVENSLVALHEERLRTQAFDSQQQANRVNFSHAESLYREGQIDMLELLDVKRALLASELSYIESRTSQAIGAVQLVFALGGGWHTQKHNTPKASKGIE